MRAKKSLGQNFLKDNNILDNIADIGKITNEDIILEIGPGTGNLTEKILSKNPKSLIVVEKDKDLSKKLSNKFSNKLKIINKDILECYNNFKFDKPFIVYGNLPYNISTKILLSFLKIDKLDKKIKKFVFVFQKEVADRIVAKENTKEYGRLSVLTSWKVNASKIIDISPENFYPKPKVWSSLILLEPKSKIETFKKIKNLEHLTNIFFNNRRKMIKKPMKLLFKNYEKISKEINLDLNLRPQNISVNKFLEICKIYEESVQ